MNIPFRRTEKIAITKVPSKIGLAIKSLLNKSLDVFSNFVVEFNSVLETELVCELLP